MSRDLGGWIHSFAITETRTHTKGYTIYKISSIIFPRAIPEALTCIHVWKRFHEIKRLHRELNKRHKSLQLHGRVPHVPQEPIYLKRFDPDIIKIRKEYIIKLLDFAAQHSSLYKSHIFQSFFDKSEIVNEESLYSQCKTEEKSDNFSAKYKSDTKLIFTKNDEIFECNKLIENLPEKISNNLIRDKEYYISSLPSIDNDYIYEAALEFSQAVQAEVNKQYQLAYDKYKRGIEKLSVGSKVDMNEDRRFIAENKVSKYMSRIEEIHQKYLAKDAVDSLADNEIEKAQNKPPLISEIIERSITQLTRLKVLQIIDSVMKVQDITNRDVFIMKVIEKPSNDSEYYTIFFPTNIPYMVKVLAFMQSEDKYYLFLEQAKGGKLYDYIASYVAEKTENCDLNELFSDIKENNPKNIDETLINTFDLGLVITTYEQDCKISKENLLKSTSKTTKTIQVPSFSSLSQDMEVSDLLSCSAKLLKSVTRTLEQTKTVSCDESIVTDIDIKSQLPKVSTNCINEINPCDIFKKDSIVDNLIGVKIYDKISGPPEASIKQWARELLIAIEHLHLKDIILGDLNPKNILLGNNGQLLLSYFYKIEGDENIQNANIDLFVLRDLYVAPERPLTKTSDFWSFGVILFELLTGYTFKSFHPAGLLSYYEIQYPNTEISNEAKDLLNGTLSFDPKNRYKLNDIKLHPFFEGTNWKSLTTSS